MSGLYLCVIFTISTFSSPVPSQAFDLDPIFLIATLTAICDTLYVSGRFTASYMAALSVTSNQASAVQVGPQGNLVLETMAVSKIKADSSLLLEQDVNTSKTASGSRRVFFIRFGFWPL